MGLWSIIVPEAGTQLILNPSAETTGNFGNHNSGTVTRITTYARFGDYCYQVATGAANRGMTLTVGALAATDHYLSFYARGNAAATLEVSADASNYLATAVIGGATGGWVRYGVVIPSAQASGSTSIIIRDTANETFYIDGVQLQALGYATTYIDGDQGPLYRWSGLRHASTSTRDAQDRLGGRERDLDDFGVYVTGTPGVGLAPQINNMVGQSLQPGAAFQSGKLMPRVVTLNLSFPGTSLENMHARRQDFIDLVQPGRVRGNQPFVLGYGGADSGATLYAAFRYDGGLEFGKPRGFLETPTVRLLAVDPYWYEDNRETASLDFQDSVSSSAYANRRTNGQWLALGSGMSATANCIVVDQVRGRVYYGFDGTTANGVTVNYICYWNGSTFVAMDGGVNNAVESMALAANGDLWVVGFFTTVGSGAAATKGVARWNISTGTWTAFNESTASFTSINSVAISPTGVVYIAGIFTDWEGDGGSDYIASTSDNGVNWDAVGTTPFSASLYVFKDAGLAFDASGNLFAATIRTGTNISTLFKWNGSAWSTVGSTESSASSSLLALHFASDGLLYIVGSFSTLGGVTAANVAVYNGSTFAPLGSGLNDVAYSVRQGPDGSVYVSGAFTSAGGIAIADRFAVWNGSVWTQPDIDFPGSPNVYAVAFSGSDIFVAYNTTGTATAAGMTTITPSATAPVYPTFTLIGPSSASATLQWLENQSTGHRLYFNLTVYAGETITIDLMPGQRRVTSDWRGVIANQPLSNSDWAAWHLLGSPASNTVAAFITGTTTAAALLAHWQPRHLSVDGVA